MLSMRDDARARLDSAELLFPRTYSCAASLRQGFESVSYGGVVDVEGETSSFFYMLDGTRWKSVIG